MKEREKEEEEEDDDCDDDEINDIGLDFFGSSLWCLYHVLYTLSHGSIITDPVSELNTMKWWSTWWTKIEDDQDEDEDEDDNNNAKHVIFSHKMSTNIKRKTDDDKRIREKRR